MKKYLVVPGEIASQTDGDIHHISARRLMELYKVHPDDCYVLRPDAPPHTQGLPKGLIVLKPLYEGNYEELAKQIT